MCNEGVFGEQIWLGVPMRGLCPFGLIEQIFGVNEQIPDGVKATKRYRPYDVGERRMSLLRRFLPHAERRGPNLIRSAT
jgi:hypothetical protein